jgi:hypothetical protein
MQLTNGSLNAARQSVTLLPKTAGTLINIGGPNAAGTLGLTIDELSQVFAGTLRIGSATSGTITVSAAITLPTATGVSLISGCDIDFNPGSINTSGGPLTLATGGTGSVQPLTSGTDANVAPAALGFVAGSNLAIVISGAAQYSQLNVAGDINLTGANLVLSGAYTPVAGQTFTVVSNSGTHPISGTFNGLPEGATILNFLGSGLDAVISYVGGDGNDVVLKAVTPLPAAHFSVTAPATVHSGTATSVTVTAIDQNNNPTSAYTGTVHFTSTDVAASLPANMILINGKATFSATLVTVGAQTISAIDTVSPGITGTSNQIAVTPATTQFAVSAPSNVTAGTPFTVTVTAEDSAGHTDNGYLGTVQLTSTDAHAVLPLNATLTNGVGTFQVTLKSAGTWNVTATDTVTASISGISGSITNSPGAASSLTVTAPAAAMTGPVNVTVTALDLFGNIATGYTGTVHFTSSDLSALLPADATLTNGAGILIVTLKTPGSQTITVTDQSNNSLTATTSPIAVTAGPFSKFVFNVQGSTSVGAGTAFLVTAQAADQFGNSVSVPGSATLNTTPNDPLGNWPITSALNGLGTGYFLVNLKTAGSYTLTAMAGSVSTSSNSVTVTPANASYFKVTADATATTGIPTNVTVTALDLFGNLAIGYSGHVHFTSSDASAGLPADATLTSGVGIFRVTLKSAGSQIITATDNADTLPTITGTSAVITTRGLTVTAFTPTADGFTVTFSKAFDPSKLTLYGSGLATVQDVTLIGAHSGPIPGSVYVDPSNQSITFKATESALQTFFSTPILPQDTYTVTLVSGSSNGFTDGTAPLDGANNAGHANYTTTFTTANQTKTILSLPDFARGPDGSHNIQIPADTGHGIPVTLTNATTVSAATFTLNYNPTLLTVTGASSGDATTGGALALLGTPTIIDATHATANFQYTSTTPQSGTVVLGDIIATVPNTAAANYKAKELLTLTSITVNGNAFTGVATSAVHVNAYFGDVTGNGSIDALDVAFANNVAQGNATGFGAYTLLDPAIIGDVAGDISVDAGDVSTLAAYVSQLPTPKIPAIRTGLTITPASADPTLSLSGEGRGVRGDTVSVLLDQPHPKGSTGMTEAVLALTYDPTAFSVSPADITLGSIPSLGTGWQFSAAIDAATGRIVITLYSTTPISADQAGSLVQIAFHPLPGAARPASTVQLVKSVEINGEEYVTQLDDAQGRLVLSPGADSLTAPILGRRSLPAVRGAGLAAIRR